MSGQTAPRQRLRPAWAGILAWLCILAGFVLAIVGLFVPVPASGWSIVGLILAMAGLVLVAYQQHTFGGRRG